MEETAKMEKDEETGIIGDKSNQHLYLDYLNLQEEKKMLEGHIVALHEQLFDTRKIIVGSSAAEELLFKEGMEQTPEILYKELGEDYYLILYEDGVDGNVLTYASREAFYNDTIYDVSLQPKAGINWYVSNTNSFNNSYTFFAGIITNKQIHTVQVILDKQLFDTTIVKVNDAYSLWYGLSDAWEDGVNVKAQALDSIDEIIWEEADFNW